MPARLVAPRSIRRVWILTFELSPIVKVGGLGEAVRSFARSLASEGLDVTVMMPSHGRHLDLGVRNRYGLRPLDFMICGERRGLDGKGYGYCLGAEEGQVDNIRVIMFKGLDYVTGSVFDSWHPYSYVEEKAAMLTRAIKAFSWNEVPPDLVHVNDWHTVLAGVALRDEFEKRGFAIPVLFTIHLSGSPSFPWHYASPNWAGLDEDPHLVWRVWRHELVLNKALWDSVGGNVELFGVHSADAVQTVSYSYLEELKGKYGTWIAGKSCVAYNSTDWSIDEVDAWLKSNYGSINREVAYEIIERYVRPGSMGSVDSTDRPLVLFAGRLTSQKGADLAVRALDHAPSVNLVLLGIPVGDYGYEQYLRSLISERNGRVIMTTNRVPDMAYRALVRLSSAVVVPSRWEPFGLVAVESLAVGTPVIATSVGGLREIVTDLRSGHGDGLLTRPEDPVELGNAMESLAHIMWDHDISKVPIPELRTMAKENPTLDSDISSFAMSRVERDFRPSSTAKQLLKCYELARTMAYYRAISS